MQALEPELADAPADALPELHALVERMLVERGYHLGDPVGEDGDDPEVLAEFRAARDTMRMLERGEDVGPGDVAAAVNGYRTVYDHLISERSSP